jgi:hypothetical protein
MNQRSFNHLMLLIAAFIAVLLGSQAMAAWVGGSATNALPVVEPNFTTDGSHYNSIGSILGTVGALICLGVLSLASLLRGKSRAV